MKEFLSGTYIKYKSTHNLISDNLLGDKNYRKFVIISDSRTGSTLLMQLLNSHPEILCFGEEFKNLKIFSCRQIWNKIYRKRPKSVNWVGFKLFYFHPWQSNDHQVWDFLEADKNVLIVHLTRRNILRSYVSKQIGLKTRKWTENINRPHEISEEEKKVKLDPEACRENFESISGYIEQTEKRFKDHKIIPVVYEDLDKDKQTIMDRIYKNLGVANFKVATYMKKQNPEKLEDLIVNYSDLKREFSGTKWEYLFEE
jgi:LPS sulfotransferase NodH